MKKVLLPFIITVAFSINSNGFFNLKNNKIEQEKFLYVKNLDVKSFFKLFTEKYKKNSKFNSITLAGEFPENWVKSTDVQYLMSILNSKKKCCNYMNVFSSTFSNEEAEVGGFAIIFLNSYIYHTKINLGLNTAPKTDAKSIQKINNWYQKKTKKP